MNKIDNIVNHAEVSEKSIEKYLVETVKNLGGICLKYTDSNMVGYPDRICLLPDGVTIWVELKSKGRKPSGIQRIRFARMEKLGHHVRVIDNKKDIDLMLKMYC